MSKDAGVKSAASTVLVTGGTGFLGTALIEYLVSKGTRVRLLMRTSSPSCSQAGVIEYVTYKDFFADPQHFLEGVQTVYHLAGRAHKISKDSKDNSEREEILRVNCDLTRKICQLTYQWSDARFVYVSSLAVYGLQASDVPLSELTPPAPNTAYGESKLAAEEIVQRLAIAYGRDYVIVRPPLVYGRGAPANFGALERLSRLPFPLPFGRATAPRALIGRQNLAAFLHRVGTHPGARQQIFVVTEEALSVHKIIHELRWTQGRKQWLLNVPPYGIRILLTSIGRGQIFEQLFGPLLVDDRKARALVEWTPPLTAREELSSAPSRMHDLRCRQRAYLGFRNMAERLISAVALTLLALPMAGIALLIRLTSPGPALFVQERAGQYHRPFFIYKFRTMRIGTPHLSTAEMMESGRNPITPLGAFLRRTSIDELPQLFNVFRGEMSLVGPRPALLTQEVVLRGRESAGVHRLRPGITGLAQITGRDDLPDTEKIRRDTIYLRQLGPATDLILLLYTLRRVVKAHGAY